MDIQKSAIISDCGLYRYFLSRKWSEGKKLLIIGLNPSIADATIDDPTIRRCIGFAKRDGFGELWMANLFAFRSTDPKGLQLAKDPIGSENNRYLLNLNLEADLTVIAWGTLGTLMDRDKEVLKMLKNIKCFGKTKDGHPKHPLYLAGNTPIISY